MSGKRHQSASKKRVEKKTRFSLPKKDAPKAQAASKKPAKGWEFAPFTKKSVTFQRAATELAKSIKDTYGDGISIAQFEKMCIARAGLSDDQKDLIYLDTGLINLLSAYQKARDARDTERASFRGDVEVKDIEGAMAALKKDFEIPGSRPGDDEALDGDGVDA